MNRTELKEKLEKLGIKARDYSLYGDLNPDCVVLYHSYYEWQVFYFNERGGRDSMKIFTSEDDACNYILNKFMDWKKMGY